MITQSAQLLSWAVVFIYFAFPSPPKKKPFSLAYDPPESEPWQAFLVPSVPKRALNELGASYLALRVLVGPIRFLHLVTASSATNSNPTTTSLVINY